MTSTPESKAIDRLMVERKKGMWSEAANVWIDPRKPVACAVITHAHADHAHPGSDVYWATPNTAAIARRRLGRWAVIKKVEYGQRFAMGDAQLTFFPAGHMLGSAQVRIEADGMTLVFTGDFKRQPDGTAEPFEVVPCDVFVTEATFARPEFVWPSAASVCEELVAWQAEVLATGESPVFVCYGVGKAQRVLSMLGEAGIDNVAVSGDIESYNSIYQSCGVSLPPTRRLSHASGPCVAMVSPQSTRSRSLRNLGSRLMGFVSGWAQGDGNDGPNTQRYHRVFCVSDHADWPALMDTARATGARVVRTVHGDGTMLLDALASST